MAELVLKALHHGVERIPDRVFHAVPGGYFREEDRRRRNKSESRSKNHDRGRRRSHRGRTAPTDSSSVDYGSDFDSGRRRDRHRRRRAKSLGYSRSPSPSPSPSPVRERRSRRAHQKSTDGIISGDPSRRSSVVPPAFPPPPPAAPPPGHAAYAPAAFPAVPAGAAVPSGYPDRRASAVHPERSAPSQVNTHLPRTAVSPALFALGQSPVDTKSPWFDAQPGIPRNVPALSRSRTDSSIPLLSQWSPVLDILSSPASPFETSFTPSHEPPLATLLRQRRSDDVQPQRPSPVAAGQYHAQGAYGPPPVAGASPTGSAYATTVPGMGPMTAAAAPGVSPVNTAYSPVNTGFAPYNPASYAPPGHAYVPTTHASPPAFYPPPSHAQPSVGQYNQHVDPAGDLAARGRRSSASAQRSGEGTRARSVGGEADSPMANRRA